jgi:homoserine kinase
MTPPSLRTDPVRVQVPATSANLGPGFDSFGLCLGVADDLVAMVTDDPGVLVEVVGEGEATLPRDESNLVVRAMARAFDRLGVTPSGLILRCRNVIPHGRGLGSSAGAIVGGLLLARALVPDGQDLLDDEALLHLAATMEGHPDNVAAALLGGFTVSWVGAAVDGATGEYVELARAVRLEPHPGIVPVVAVPDEPVPTATARAVLPEQVPFSAATFNIGRAALLVHALTRDPSLLMVATEDRLHQDARRAVYAASYDVVAALRAEGIPAVISGAGPTVLALASATVAPDVTQVVPAGWIVRSLAVDAVGARVLPVATAGG